MIENQLIFTILGIIASLIGYIIYLSQLLKHRIRPHAFTWFIWGIMMAIIFFAQIEGGGGIGSLVVGFNSIFCFIVAFISFFLRSKNYITKSDWICLLIAILGIFIWQIANNPLFAIILVIVADFFGFIPTIRKSYIKPNEENATLFVMGFFKFIFSIIALEAHNFLTLAYPVFWVFVNLFFVVLLLVRRHQEA